MKWLVILLFLPIFSNGQIHSLDWHLVDTNYWNLNTSSFIWLDSKGNSYTLISTGSDSLQIKHSNSSTTFNSDWEFQILKEHVNGNFSMIPLLKHHHYSSSSFKMFGGQSYIYLVWYLRGLPADTFSDNINILDTSFNFSSQPFKEYPVQVLKISKDLDQVFCNRFKLNRTAFSPYSFSHAEEDLNEELVLFFNRANAGIFPPDTVFIEDTALTYDITEYGSDMILLGKSLLFKKAAISERFVVTENDPISFKNTFSTNFFISGNDFGKVLTDLDVVWIDSFNTNLRLLNHSTWQCEAFSKLYCLGQTSASEIILNNENVLNSYNGCSTVLFSIDSTGKTSYLDQIKGCANPSIQLNKGILWLKIHTTSKSFKFLNEQFVVNYWNAKDEESFTTWYIAINENNKVVKKVQGPFKNLLSLELPLQFYKNSIHDIEKGPSHFNLYGDLHTYSYKQSRNKVIFKNSFVYSLTPQFRPKLSYRYIDCNSIEINYNKTDADHFLIIHSNDTIFSLPKDDENYNYSNDFLIAPRLDNDKVIYQGSDSSIIVKNLPPNRKHYFLIVPGNGVSGATTYNVDSVDTIEVFIPAISKAKLSISPSNDTSICQGDTIFATATSTYPIRWMDGKTDNRRFVPETDHYYFTIKDSQGCVVSSDTVTITKHPTPEINRIVASQKPPFCLGDSVWFAANSFQLGAHPDSTKHASKAMKTGWYVVKLTNRFGCQSIDSTYAEFGTYPNFKFLQDSVLSLNNRIRLDYKTNADSLLWVYATDTINDYNYFLVNDSQYLFVNAIDERGCNIWDSILTMYKEPISEAFPNAFSPNGDGLNDEWYFLHPDTAGTLIIYDRWGGIVHHGQNRWDGKKNGELLPVGAYCYTFIYQENGEEKIKRGLISLIR